MIYPIVEMNTSIIYSWFSYFKGKEGICKQTAYSSFSSLSTYISFLNFTGIDDSDVFKKSEEILGKSSPEKVKILGKNNTAQQVPSFFPEFSLKIQYSTGHKNNGKAPLAKIAHYLFPTKILFK